MRDLNFFSSSINARKSSQGKRLTLILVFFASVLIIASVYIVTELKAVVIQEDIAAMDAYLKSEDVAKKRQDILERRTKLEVAGKYYNAVESIRSDIDRIDLVKSSLLEQISKTLPAGVVFKKLSFTDNTITIQGTSTGQTKIAELHHNFNSMDIFREVFIGNIQKQAENTEGYDFDIQCTLKDVVRQ